MRVKIITDKRNKKKFNVSILFSFFNNEDTIEKSLESLLEQTYNNLEIIIFSDGSKDKSDQIVKRLLFSANNVIFLKSDKNNGLTKSLNYMLRFSSGSYLARHDADDISCKKRIEHQINFLTVNKNIDVLGSNSIYFLKGKKKYVKMPEDNYTIKKLLPKRNTIIHSSIIIRRRILFENNYDSNFLRCQDYELWLRLKAKINYYNLQKYLIMRDIDGDKFNFIDLYFSGLARFKHLSFFKFFIFTIKDIIIFTLKKTGLGKFFY
tara:strand:- start:7522 stop:8313 length:792 start_codon:yes stop_codon:yes gene_type:complete